MKSIAYVLPYFGKFPKGFDFWLLSCAVNPTIDFLIFTNDKTPYKYTSNVHVIYCELKDIKDKAQRLYDFKICLERPYKLCDFKPAYGEIFSDELKDYDFWGHCDLDMVWGNIRKFITEDILEEYDKIGNQGHSTLYRNTPEVNARYRTCFEGEVSFREVFSSNESFAFDEPTMEMIYQNLGIDYYRKVNFVHLKKYDYGFFMDLLPQEDDYKNENQIFEWNEGRLFRFYLEKNGEIVKEEYMYLHYWCRPTTFKFSDLQCNSRCLIYPDVTTDCKYKITTEVIKKRSSRNPFRYYIKSIWFNRKKITFERILFNIKGMSAYKKE